MTKTHIPTEKGAVLFEESKLPVCTPELRQENVRRESRAEIQCLLSTGFHRTEHAQTSSLEEQMVHDS